MRPEDIQTRDFLVGLRGYDKDEVRSFLAKLASEHAALQAELEDARNVAMTQTPADSGPDECESLGASVAAVLRAAKDSAREIIGEAEGRRVDALEAAEEAVRAANAEADQIRADAQADAQALLADAEARAEQVRSGALSEARAEAERLVREAAERARQLEIESEARINNAAEEAARREAAVRTRLLEAGDEIQLALLALGETAPLPTDGDTDGMRDDEAPAHALG